MKAEIFRTELEKMLKVAKEIGLKYIDITSGDLHRKVGGYPGKKPQYAIML